jgi:hypothetical protein
MSALLSASPLLTPEQYLTGEALGGERHGFITGEAHVMASSCTADDTIASLLFPDRCGHGILGCCTWKTRFLRHSTRPPCDPAPSCRGSRAGCQESGHFHRDSLSARTYHGINIFSALLPSIREPRLPFQFRHIPDGRLPNGKAVLHVPPLALRLFADSRFFPAARALSPPSVQS